MHSLKIKTADLEVAVFDRVHVQQSVLVPETKLGHRCVERVETDLDAVCWVSSMDRQL